MRPVLQSLLRATEHSASEARGVVLELRCRNIGLEISANVSGVEISLLPGAVVMIRTKHRMLFAAPN
jgi:hypothetical protein